MDGSIPLLVAMVLVLIIILTYAKHDRKIICFFVPTDGSIITKNVDKAFLIGLHDSGQNVDVKRFPLKDSFETKSIDEHLPRFLKETEQYKDENILIIAGASSDHLERAMRIVRESQRNILCMSLGATGLFRGNYLLLVHRGDIAMHAMAIYLRYHNKTNVLVYGYPIWKYSNDYVKWLLPHLTQQDINYKVINTQDELLKRLNEIKINDGTNMTTENTAVFTIRPIKDFISLVNLIPIEFMVVTPTTGIDAEGLTRNAVVQIPSVTNYTLTTRRLYRRLGKDNHSYLVPFVYDLAFQIGNMIKNNVSFTLKEFCNRQMASRPAAALVSTWFDEKEKYPRFGGYWFINTKDDKTKEEREKIKENLYGNFVTLKDSVNIECQIGYFQWAGISGWNIYKVTPEIYKIPSMGIIMKDKYSYQSLVTDSVVANWSPSHIRTVIDRKGKIYFPTMIDDHVITF